MTPALFIGHGSPTNTFSDNVYTQTWRSLGERLERPKALLVISAHWFFGTTAVTAMAAPRTIHDFYGFPEPLASFQYPAPGSPELAARVADLVRPQWMGLDQDQWGLDHGTWSVLAHMYPQADVPVVQLSLNALKPMEYHLELGQRLAPLRNEGVMILGTGNVVHNLGMMQRHMPDSAYDWAQRFDDAVQEQLARAPEDILKVCEHPDYAMAVPTPEHFLPLLYLAGLASASGSGSGKGQVQTLLQGCTMGSLSMTSYGLNVLPLPQ